ncbi:hypothetical protein KI659_06950 [Litoribacter alkaliphilus]|uniref:Uncharacterized protein n=1 Tax=Litoribacter ruber TaxID=702568 RepID=A0AAP2CJK3_9BACT|nr:hypothetical protein [Litoribacter alkaliphilus]MBS9523755.1 hypothetical protein [Litoribacter alkaliphilus]
MKKLFLIALTAVFLSSCSNEGGKPNFGHSGTWEVVEVQNSWTGEVTPASELSYSESYELRGNMTFTKFNSHLGIDLTGTYQEVELEEVEGSNDVLGFILSFDPEPIEKAKEVIESEVSILINNDPFYFAVYGIDLQESLRIRRDGSMINSGHGIMDGPIYIYQKNK